MLAFQLAVYTAAGRSEGIDVRAAYVHDLRAGERVAIDVATDRVDQAADQAEAVARALRSAKFPYNAGDQCRTCDVRWVCPNGKVAT
jgi:CRISPR/Cas system-associated exonuclease Cas4 (RecB family)